LALALSACSLSSSSDEEDDTGGSAPRCEDCVGEDGGAPAAPPLDGQTVAVLETTVRLPVTDLVLRGTFPVPPFTYPRGDGKNPFVMLDWDGTPLVTQTELVSRYAHSAEGADVVEVLARVHVAPGTPDGVQARYSVVYAPHAPPTGPGAPGLEDLRAPAGLTPTVLALLDDPSGIEIRTRDCFGNTYACRPLDGSGSYKLMRHGRVSSELRVFQMMRPEPPVPGASGTLPHSLGVHAYLSTLTGHDILGLTLRFTNAGSGRDQGTDLDDPLDKHYFESLEVVVPAGLELVQDFSDPFYGSVATEGARWVWPVVEPIPGKLHVLRWQGQFHRRLWLGTSAEIDEVVAYSDSIGQAFCVRGTDSVTGRALWSWWNKGTARYFPQRFLLPSLEHMNLVALRNTLAGQRFHLENRLANGTSDGDYPIQSNVLGWGHPYGVSYGGMTSGAEIFLYDGVGTAASAATHGYPQFAATHRMHTDRHPTALYDLDGEPSSFERWRVENGDRDYIPFTCYLNPLLTGNYPDPFGFRTAPRFQIDFVAGNGLAPSYESQHLAFEPHDLQHFIRYTRSAKVLAWLGNDSLAKDDLRMQAELVHLSYHDLRNHPNGSFFQGGLLAHRAFVNANPGKGFGFGRGEAWGLDCMLAAYSLADPTWRANKLPWFRTVSEVLMTGQGVCTGFIQAIVSNKAVNGLYRARQQIEQSITESALQGLRETVFRRADPAYEAMTRDLLLNSLYAFIGEMAWFPGQAAPFRYTGIGPLDIAQPIWCRRGQMPGNAITPGDLEAFQDWCSFAWGYEITGDPIFLERATTQIGVPNLFNRLLNDGAQNLENRAALLALLQHENGQF
jgi:hypothetical protein